MITLLLAGSSDLYIDLLTDRLHHENDIKVLSRAKNTLDIQNKLKGYNPDILFIDTSLSDLNYLLIFDTLKKENKKTKLILLFNNEDDETVIEALCSGIKGCLKPSSGYENFLEAVRTVMEERIWADSRILSQALKKFIEHLNYFDSANTGLTKRELEVSDFIVKGLSNKAIAKNLAISEKTVKAHIGHIFKKLGIKHRYQLSPNIVNKHAIFKGFRIKA